MARCCDPLFLLVETEEAMKTVISSHVKDKIVSSLNITFSSLEKSWYFIGVCIMNLDYRKLSACQKLGGGPVVGKCPIPGQRKICYCLTPGTNKAGKCPTIARRRGGGVLVQLELTGNEVKDKGQNFWRSPPHIIHNFLTAPPPLPPFSWPKEKNGSPPPSHTTNLD